MRFRNLMSERLVAFRKINIVYLSQDSQSQLEEVIDSMRIFLT